MPKYLLGDDVGTLLVVLESLQTKENGIIITTSKDSKGVDFLGNPKYSEEG